jgi:hypothetical protein
MGILGVRVLVLLVKLEFVLASAAENRSLCRPSRMCRSSFSELVAVTDWRKKMMVLWNKVRRSSSSTSAWRIGSRKAADRTSRLPH